MYLKRLELQGFKSFADKTVLEFKPGITSVIGPNGSGKSNISDAIRWILGEQSMKSLRGAKSEDIIFAGTQARKSLGFAEGSIIIDNTDGELPIEYSEVTVTRKIYRSGETGYFINKVPCRLKDILELFMDTGIGKDGYSIIGQGKIDEILSNKSEDRRHIFEEAAGIVKYRVRKQESEKKLEQTKLNLLRINDILSEIEGNIEPLKIQADKARHFLDLREELKNIEVGLFLTNIDTYKEKIKQIGDDKNILDSQRKDMDNSLNKIKNEKDSLKMEVDKITSDIEKTQNIGFESANKIEKINTEIEVSKQKISNNEENKNRLQIEIEDIEKRLIELEGETKERTNKKEDLEKNREKYLKELEQKEQELNKLTEKLSEKALEIEKKKEYQEQRIEEKYELSANIKKADANIENIEKRLKNIEDEIRTNIMQKDGLQIEKQENSSTFYNIELERNKLLEEVEKIKKEKQNISKHIKEYEEKENKINYELKMKEARYKFLQETEKEKEGYTRSVKSLLLACDKNEEIKKGVHGVLADLINVPKEYEIAIEMSLGLSMQNIVTEKEEEAKRLVEYLRKNNLGRASFLPISSVKGKMIEKFSKNNIDGIIGIASKLVKYDKKYDGIINNLLGRTVIVKDMDTAIKLAKLNNYSFRIVTISGDVINPSGAITGGSVQNRTVNILGRKEEIKDLKFKIAELEKELEKVKYEKEQYTNRISEDIEEGAKKEKSLQEKEIEYATEKQKILVLEEKISVTEREINKLKSEKESLKSEKENILLNKDNMKKTVDEIDEELEKTSIEIEQFANKNKDEQIYIDDLKFNITNLKISVSSFDESKDSINEIINRINEEIKSNILNLETKNNKIDEYKKENDNLLNKIDNLNKEILEVKEKTKSSKEKIEELKNQREIKQEKLYEIEEKITEQYASIEELNNQINKVELKKSKYEQDLEHIINSMWEDYRLTPNKTEGFKRPENITVATKQVSELKEAIKELGSVNVDSIDEYKKTKERYDFMCEQRLDLESSANKLRKVIIDMTKEMQEQFAQKFKEINKNFNDVFIELFGGGKAELILEDENNILECGIDIRVQPTGKKLQNMMLLSGGEKAFTAIALLFAILKINPAPFCILDEIEAALDDVNVYRFAEYLKKFSKQTQFLVITHRKGTMEVADTVYGVTMEENGISKLLSMKLAKEKIGNL